MIRNLGWTDLGKNLPEEYRSLPYYNFQAIFRFNELFSESSVQGNTGTPARVSFFCVNCHDTQA